MKKIAYDFHIHSCLSPCADNEMTPANIVGMAVVAGLDAIAITDHNSCLNCRAAIKVGEKYNITVIPGMELCTREEVHVICLFYTIEDAERFSSYIREHMVQIKNHTKFFGEQRIVDEKDEQTGIEDYLLLAASNLSFNQVFDKMQEYHGVMIPAHLDKQSNSLVYQLGFVPEDARFTCFELKNPSNIQEYQKKYPYLSTCRFISNSDAHQLGDINGPEQQLQVKECTVTSILDTLCKRE